MLLSGLMFAQGIVPSMSGFGIPDEVLHSPHYYDAMLYVFYHQFVSGAALFVVGIFAREPLLKIWLVRVLTVLYFLYTYFDFRASDSALGNALYKGPQSLVPPIFALFFTSLLLQLNFRKKPGS